jgi:hypothetical protein
MNSSVLLLALIVSLTSTPSEPDYIPLQKGYYWIYKAHVQWIEADPQTGQNEPHSKTLLWRSEIIDVCHVGPSCTVALFHGWPEDLDWYNSKAKPSDRLILRIGTDYYQIMEGARTLFDQIRKANGDIRAVFHQLDVAELYLPTPLALGKSIGGSPSNQIEGRYCDVVQDVNPFNLATVKNAMPVENPVDYSITYRSSPEIITLDVVPGLGIVHHSYHHNGTTMEVDAMLIEFGPPPSEVPSSAGGDATVP